MRKFTYKVTLSERIVFPAGCQFVEIKEYELFSDSYEANAFITAIESAIARGLITSHRMTPDGPVQNSAFGTDSKPLELTLTEHESTEFPEFNENIANLSLTVLTQIQKDKLSMGELANELMSNAGRHPVMVFSESNKVTPYGITKINYHRNGEYYVDLAPYSEECLDSSKLASTIAKFIAGKKNEHLKQIRFTLDGAHFEYARRIDPQVGSHTITIR